MTIFETVNAYYDTVVVIRNYLKGLCSEKEALNEIVRIYFGK